MPYIEEQAAMPAPAERVYAVLADYRVAHPRILPRPPFGDIVVEEGGTGTGTVFRVTSRSLGQTREFRMRVSEPEAGRVLRETDLPTGLWTDFVVTPTGPTSCTLKLATTWKEPKGIRGWIERLVGPRLLRGVYRRELALIAAYVQTNPTAQP